MKVYSFILIVSIIASFGCKPYRGCKLHNQKWKTEKVYSDSGELKVLTKTKCTHSCPDLGITITKTTLFNEKGKKSTFIKTKSISGWNDSVETLKNKNYK